MKGQRGQVSRCHDPAQQGRRLFGGGAEFRAEIIGRARHRQLEARRDLAARRQLVQKLLKLGDAVYRPGLHARAQRMGDLGHRAHRIVVMPRRAGDQPPDQVDLGRGGHVEAPDALGRQHPDQRRIGIGLDRIGDHAGKPVTKAPGGCRQPLGVEHHHGLLGGELSDQLGRVSPDRPGCSALGQSHRRLPAVDDTSLRPNCGDLSSEKGGIARPFG